MRGSEKVIPAVGGEGGRGAAEAGGVGVYVCMCVCVLGEAILRCKLSLCSSLSS